MTDAYQDSLDFLFGRLNYERQVMPRSPGELRLGRMRRLLRLLGDPQRDLRIVHVAGTKGKGSTAAMIAAAISASGVRVGLFSSPHLHRLEERYNIDGREAGPAEIVALTDAIRPAIAELDALDFAAGRRSATFFEVTTAMGLLHFARRGVGAVVLEVGLGGRLDSTNVVRPAVSLITTISYDHTRQLGSTLPAIAGEKAGIIKRGRPTVCGVEPDEPRAVVERVAAARGSKLRQIGRDFSYDYQRPTQPMDRPAAGRVQVRTWARDWGEVELPLLGKHQAHNAALAMATLDVLAEQGIEVGPQAVARGFASMQWPARIEVLGREPWLVIDGAHNVASARALADTLRDSFPDCPRTLVFGTTRDKDLRGQLEALLPQFDVVVATKYVENPRAVPPEDILEEVHALDGRRCELARDPGEALALARALTSPSGLICVTGSLFLAAETRSLVLGRNDPTPNQSTLI